MLTKDDIKVGSLYKGKKRRKAYGLAHVYYDDRVVLHIDALRETVQYDSYFVKDGRNYPKTSMEKFLNWAKEEIVENSDA